MNDFFDFNTAEVGSDFSELIPDGTVCTVVTKLRPGAAGPKGWLKSNRDGSCFMADFEFTIEGAPGTPHNGRKFWDSFIVEIGDGATEGHKTAVGISRKTLRSMIESARGVKPGDDSAEALAKRKVSGYEAFDGLRFCAKVKLERGELKDARNGPDSERYPDKNRLLVAVTPDSRSYIAPAASEQPSTYSAPQAPSAPSGGATISRPSWG